MINTIIDRDTIIRNKMFITFCLFKTIIIHKMPQYAVCMI